MASLRDANLLGQQRVDVGTLQLIEAGVRGDYDAAFGTAVAGGEPLVIQGFEIVTTGAVGAPASAVQINTAGSLVFNPLASASGTVFNVPLDRQTETLSATNPRVNGSFAANSTNYVSIDFVRTPDDSTSDVVQFLQPSQNREVAEEVPLARTADYVIYISTQPFGAIAGLCPIAVIVTNSFNNVSSITDSRPLAFALSSGGTDPDLVNVYNWPGGRTTGSVNNFTSGDKSIYSQKDWQNATMTRLWELGGGQRWFSPTADRNVKMIRSGAPFVATGDWFNWDGTNLLWTGLYFLFDNSTGIYNQVANQTVSSPGLTDLADGECIYVDLDRGSNRTGLTALQAVKAPYASLGTPTVPGARWIIAYRFGTEVYARDSQWKVNAALPPATTAALGAVRLNITPGNPSSPVVVAINSSGSVIITETAGATNAAINGIGLTVVSGDAGRGVVGTGGGGGNGGFAGVGVIGNGGAGTGTGTGGIGVGLNGGNAASGSAGIGGVATGGSTSAGSQPGAAGLKSQGGTSFLASAIDGPAYWSTVASHAYATSTSADSGSAFIHSVDSLTNVRNRMSALGFWTFKVLEFKENWFYAGTTAFDTITEDTLPWVITNDSSAGFTLSSANNTIFSRFLNIANNGNTSNDISMINTAGILPPVGNAALVLEMDFTVSVDGNATTDVLWAGFSSDPSDPLDVLAGTIGFRYFGSGATGGSDTGGTWRACSHASTTSVTDTGVVILSSSNPTQRMKIRVLGSTNFGTQRVQYFIDDALVATHTTATAFLASGAMGLFFSCYRDAAATTRNLRLGPVKTSWNLTASV